MFLGSFKCCVMMRIIETTAADILLIESIQRGSFVSADSLMNFGKLFSLKLKWSCQKHGYTQEAVTGLHNVLRLIRRLVCCSFFLI